MTDKLHSDTQEKTETITQVIAPQDSGDLEADTSTITANAEASGVVNSDYSITLTLDRPEDARLVVKRIAARISIAIDDIPTSDTSLYCRVYVDEQDAEHRLFDEDWTSTGTKLSAEDTSLIEKETIFQLLGDGDSHTFYFFLWKDGTGTGPVVSTVQLWEGVGTCTTDVNMREVLGVRHSGLVSGYIWSHRVGTGVQSGRITFSGTVCGVAGIGEQNNIYPMILFNDPMLIMLCGTVSTDLNFIKIIAFVVRNEQ